MNTIKPKNFDSNKLINPDIIEEEYTEDEDMEDENIEDGFDEETYEIINRSRMKNINIEDKIIFQKKTFEKHIQKPKKSMSLQEFTKITQSETKVINKFTSSRVESKKKKDDIPKRQFNPRKPPYNFIRKVSREKNIKIDNFLEFPELK